MSERLNELSNNVLISLQPGKKVPEAITGLRDLYLYLFKHSVPLPSTTYNYLLTAIQDRENSKFGNAKICQLTVLVLFQANRPVKQLQQGYTRVGDLLKSGISITRECLHHLIYDLDSKLLFAQPAMWASLLHHVMLYSNKLLTNEELYSINMNIYNFIRCNPALVKRGRFARGQKYYGPNRTTLTTPLTVLCTTSSGKPSPLLLLQAISFSYVRKWLQFIPPAPMEVFPVNRADVASEYNDESSRAGGGSMISQSTMSRVTASSIAYVQQGMYNDNFDLRSDVTGGRYNPRTLNLSISGMTGSPIQDAALQHVTLVIEHCTKLTVNSKDKVVALAAYLECIKILDTIHETCPTADHVQHEIIAAMSQILSNLKTDKTKFILLPAALSVVMKHSPEFKLNPEENEYLIFLYSDVIGRSYETVTLMYEIVMFTLKFAPRIHTLLQAYIPNIFKIVAFRPTTFAREISMILPHLYHSSVVMELLLAIIQLPVLSALMVSKVKTSGVTDWLYRTRSNHASSPEVSRIYPHFNFTHPKVVACSQLAVVLLKLFLEQVYQHGDELFWECFMCLYKLPDIGDYKASVTHVVLNFIRKVCHSSPDGTMLQHQDKIADYLARVEQYPDYNTTSQLINVITPTICKSDLPHETTRALHKKVEQQLYIISAMSYVSLLNSLLLLLVVLSVKEPALNERTLTCIANIKTKVCTKSVTVETKCLSQLVTNLTLLLQPGGGSLVEIHKSPGFLLPRDTMNMLKLLKFIDKVATI